MLGPILQKSATPLWKKTAALYASKDLPHVFLSFATILAIIGTLILFGLQYFTAAIFCFGFYVLVSRTKNEIKEGSARISDTIIITGSFMSCLWTASNAGLAVAFFFWAILINIVSINHYKPEFKIIDSFELACALILIALTSADYIPPVTILMGAACLFSAAAIAVQENFLKKKD